MEGAQLVLPSTESIMYYFFSAETQARIQKL